MEHLIVDVTPQNVLEHTLFCVKDLKNPGFENKRKWFDDRYAEGLRLKILKDSAGKLIAFIEYLPAEAAWRPVNAPNYMFIHCMYVYSNKDKGKGLGSLLLKECEKDARQQGMVGITAMTSKGSWITDKRLFEKNGFVMSDKLGRFELMTKKMDDKATEPSLIDWTTAQKKYTGWHLLYADQCPWHEKSVNAITEIADEFQLNLQVHKISAAEEAKKGPSGFGVFALMHDGKLLSDHYISATRFRNIIKSEM